MHLSRLPVLFLIFCIFSTGCLSSLNHGKILSTSSGNSLASQTGYHARISQPDADSTAIHMDADVYNAGEVVEFFVKNDNLIPRTCSNTPPDFIVQYQTGTGQWVTRMGSDDRAAGAPSYLQSGESTRIFRFVTTGWEAGRYRIISDCGVSREILIRSQVALAPAAGTTCLPSPNATPFLRVNPVADRNPGEIFTITGTTNLPPDEMLVYSVFSIGSGTPNVTITRIASSAIRISAGACGVNTFSITLDAPPPGQYFVGISNSIKTVSAIKRFTVVPGGGVSNVTPENVPSGGITAEAGEPPG